MREDAPQREYTLREVFNALRYVSRSGEAWRMMPNDLPPWPVVYQQMRRWYQAGVFETMVHDLRRFYGFVRGEIPIRLLRSSTAGRFKARPKAAAARDMTEPKDARALKRISQSIRWGTFWRCV